MRRPYPHLIVSAVLAGLFASVPRGTGPPAWLLLPVSGLYRLVTALRRLAYRRGWLAVVRAGRPVIAVGNLTVGGSGKTPLVEYLVREAARAGRSAVCISRGYRRRGRAHLMRVRVDEGAPADPERMGDEPAMLALRNPSLPVYVGAGRAAASRLAGLWDDPDLIVLDDAFQHLGLARDLNLLLIDAERGLGNGRLLPRGPLREPLAAARRADAIVISKANLGDADGLRRRLASLPGLRAPVFTAEYRPRRLRTLEGGDEQPPAALAGRPVSLLCGIAGPESFARTLAGLGARVEERRFFPDHHAYHDGDLRRLDDELGAGGEDGPRWVTTEKDAVKLRGRLTRGRRLWVLEMEVVPEPAAAAFFFDFIRTAGIG